ncbi:hypothetical protein KIN20_019246 [Parelaphostrongylus tenuis]|uniref:Uncharacterized protein n=1 Tax=Parelaphostrongylus tenuis TaxID=148309 RepID=A0AAD5QS78_PARTN|nr:hypothetical protein KIN20_019246 [Parelaphostrongylus tenuis]
MHVKSSLIRCRKNALHNVRSHTSSTVLSHVNTSLISTKRFVDCRRSISMWQNVVDRALLMLRSGPFGSHSTR